MLDTDITKLTPSTLAKVMSALDAMKTDKELKGFGVTGVLVNEARRPVAFQMAYWTRGRLLADDVKAFFKAAGLWNITEAESAQTVTWTLESKHIVGKAVDLVPTKDGVTKWWTPPRRVWERMGEIGEAAGLQWGGRWKDKSDTPHFEEA